MKNKLFILVLAFVVFMVGFLSYQWFFPDTFFSRLWKNIGELSVNTKPSASVFVDNVLVGQTPLQVSLPQGVHAIKLVPEATKDVSLQSWSDKIKIYKNTTTYVRRVLSKSSDESAGETIIVEKSDTSKGQILVSTRPSGVFVSLDGEQRGLSPLLLDNLDETEHELTVKSEGLLPRTIAVKTKNGYKLLIDVSLGIDKALKEKRDAEKKKAQEEKKKENDMIRILDTSTGWLRVRSEPSLEASETAKLNSGVTVPVTSEENGWYQVEYESGKTGWVSGEYVQEITPTP